MVYIFLDSDIKLIEKYIIHIQIYYDYEYAAFKICEFAMFILWSEITRLGLNVWVNTKKPNIRSKSVDYTTDVNNFLSYVWTACIFILIKILFFILLLP